MDRYQEASDRLQESSTAKPRKKKRRLPGKLGQLQTVVDHAIDRHVKHEVGHAEIMLVPRDLQTSDPSLAGEIAGGQFGLDGIFLEVGADQPPIFAHPFADDGFNRKLFGFAWLRDLRARGDDEARDMAQELVFWWLRDYARHFEGIAYEPCVIANRIRSFLTHSPFLLEGVGRKKARQFVTMLSDQIERLNIKLAETPKGAARLEVLSALVMAGLCLSRQDKMLENTEPLLMLELDRQILPDGGHCSRNPSALYRLLFALIPLKQCFKGRGRDIPRQLESAIARMLPMIRFFRLGDSSLARFNGTSTTPTDALAVLLAYDERNLPFEGYAKDSGYARLQEGGTTVMVDVGKPPANYAVKHTHAGCLSLEMSIRHFAVIVNSGAFQEEDENWRRYARSTIAHSTLSLDDHSSGGFDRQGRLTGPHQVDVGRADLSELDACHHGYVKRFGFVHQRRLTLSHEGLRLSGIDLLNGPGTTEAVGFCIRFHLHPLIELAQGHDNNLLLTLPDGEIWRFTGKGGQIGMADSVYLAYRGGPKAAHQITLSGTARPGSNIVWMFEQVQARPQP